MDNNIYTDNEYIYLTIPIKWLCLYHRLLTYMADYGKNIVDDCTATCKGGAKNIITCWNLFQSAVAAHNLGRDKEAEFFINYIEKQLKLIYKGVNNDLYNKEQPIEINEYSKLIAYVSCNNDTKFYVDVETGILYRETSEDKEENYNIENNYLIVEY